MPSNLPACCPQRRRRLYPHGKEHERAINLPFDDCGRHSRASLALHFLLMSFHRLGRPRLALVVWAGALMTSCVVSACVKAQTGDRYRDPGFPFGRADQNTTLTYIRTSSRSSTPTARPATARVDAAGNYSVGLHRHRGRPAPRRRPASLVVDCAPGGSMYRYFSGDAVRTRRRSSAGSSSTTRRRAAGSRFTDDSPPGDGAGVAAPAIILSLVAARNWAQNNEMNVQFHGFQDTRGDDGPQPDRGAHARISRSGRTCAPTRSWKKFRRRRRLVRALSSGRHGEPRAGGRAIRHSRSSAR